MRVTPKWQFLAAALLCVGAPARAAYVINYQEVAGNVVGTGSGSLNISGLSVYVHEPLGGSYVVPNDPGFNIGLGDAYVYAGSVIAPGPAGVGGQTDAGDESGLPVGAYAGSGSILSGILVPAGYVSGADLGTSTSTFFGQTFSSLGMTPGTYVFTWGRGDQADSFTVNVGGEVPGVPEPSTWTTMLLGFAAIGYLIRQRFRLEGVASCR